MHALKNVRHVQQHVIDKLFDTLQEYELMVNFHLTSVESFSRVLHKLIDLLLYLEDLLNVFCSVRTSTPSSAFPTGV
jgi:hypothetical protein